MKDISPKKYVETRARKLPIYKCFVNDDWEESQMAHVVVMRKHVNNNVTVGTYLVDLLCLGIKDTSFFVNEPELRIMELIGNMPLTFIEIDYGLAHNIVFAGRDFALDYDIEPVKEFKLTQFILEEDNDDIPLIDVHVGDEDGTPYLSLMPGQRIKYKHVYDKLVKHLGAGNFGYTTGEEELDDDEEEEEEMEFSNKLDDYEIGSINTYTVGFLDNEELLQMRKVEARNINEIGCLKAELYIRMLRVLKEDLFVGGEMGEREDIKLIDEAQMYPEWVDEDMGNEMIEMMKEEIELESKKKIKKENTEKWLISRYDKYKNNPLVLSRWYENAVALEMKQLQAMLKPTIKKLALQYPLLKLTLALCTSFLGEPDPSTTYILKAADIQSAFPMVKTFSLLDITTFWMAKIANALLVNDVETIVYYYEMMGEVPVLSSLLLSLQFKLTGMFIGIFEEYEKTHQLN
jgi:hypothetical protein